MTPSRSPKSSASSPGGVAGVSARRTPSPNRLVITAATAVSAPSVGTRRTSATPAAAPATPAAPPSSKRQPEQRGADEAGEERMRERLGAVRELVVDDPAPDDAADDPEQHELCERELHEGLAPRVHERVHQWSWWCGGRMAAAFPGKVTIAPP